MADPHDVEGDPDPDAAGGRALEGVRHAGAGPVSGFEVVDGHVQGPPCFRDPRGQTIRDDPGLARSGIDGVELDGRHYCASAFRPSAGTTCEQLSR